MSVRMTRIDIFHILNSLQSIQEMDAGSFRSKISGSS
ncbi:MAG: hypothetical protein ACD_71C00123G0003, partial [uncultured bacterium (gcode 4)]